MKLWQLKSVMCSKNYFLTYSRGEYYFVYLSGEIMGRPQGLENATLKVSGACPDYYELEMKVVDWDKKVHVRHGWEYGGPLTWWRNEIIFDSLVLFWPPWKNRKWNCSFEATTRLPDQTVIFSIAQNFTLQFPDEEDDSAPRDEALNSAMECQKPDV